MHLVGSPLKKQQPLPLGSFAAVPGIGPVRQIPALVGAWCMVMVGGVRRSTANRQYFPLN